MIPVVLRGLPTRAAMGTLALLASCAHGVLPPPTQPAAPSVDVREETLTLPTYGVKADPFPFFRATHGTTFYPYPRYDVLTHEKRDRAYHALVLENEFLRVTVLPELGGRVHSAFDKKAGREMFYRNDVIKPARITPRGAGITGGLSFQFQDGPVPGPFDPVHATTERHPDGSAAIVIGDVEHVAGLQWQIRLVLRPEAEFLELVTRIYNRTSLRQFHAYQAVAAFPVTNSSWVKLPQNVVWDEVRARRTPWPLRDGYNRSRTVTWDAPSEYSSRDWPGEIIAYYDDDLDYGAAYSADAAPLNRLGFRTPGREGVGTGRVAATTEPHMPYVELFSTFRHVGMEIRLWVESHETVAWRERWHPLRGQRPPETYDSEPCTDLSGLDRFKDTPGLTSLRRGLWPEAERQLGSELRDKPERVGTRHHLAVAHRRSGKTQDAAEAFETSASSPLFGEEARAQYFLGELALRRRAWAGAAKHFQAALERNPDDLRAAAHLLIAQARMQFDGLTDRPPDRAVLARGLALDPLDLPLRFAERFMNRDYGVTDLIPDDRCGLFSTLEFLDLGFLRVPAETGMRCRDAVPLARLVAADCSAQMGGWYYGMIASTARAEARRDAHLPRAFPAEAALLPVLEREAGRDPVNGRIHYYRGCLLLSLDRGEEAAAAFEQAAALGDDTAHLHRNLGLVRWKVMKDQDGGARHLERAVALAPQEAQPVLELDDLLAETGQRDRRVDLLEGALGRIAWRKGDVAGRLAEAYAAVERYDDAAAMLDSADFDDFGEAEKLRDLHVRVHLERGNAALAATGDLARARAAYEVAAGYPPNLLMAPPAPRHRRDARALWKLALACERLGDAAAAERARREILPEEHASDSPLAVYKGLALRALGDAPAAEGLFDEMIAAAERFKDSDPARRRLLLGLGLWGHGRRDEAAPHLEAALSRGANYEIGREFLGEK